MKGAVDIRALIMKRNMHMRAHERKAGDKINKRKNDLRRGEIQEKATF